jgi:hypothetical protein
VALALAPAGAASASQPRLPQYDRLFSARADGTGDHVVVRTTAGGARAEARDTD